MLFTVCQYFLLLPQCFRRPSFNPLPDDKILDSSKLKEFADDNFNENEIKLSKQVENTVGKGVIARYEQFLLFPQCFQKACFPGASKGVIVWEWVNCCQILGHYLDLCCPVLTSIFSFSTLFSKGFFHKVVKSRDCVV